MPDHGRSEYANPRIRTRLALLVACALCALFGVLPLAAQAGSMRRAGALRRFALRDQQLLSPPPGNFGSVLGSNGTPDELSGCRAEHGATDLRNQALQCHRPEGSAGHDRLHGGASRRRRVSRDRAGKPHDGRVGALLICLAPVNAAAVRLERELAQLESQMVAHPCTGQGPVNPGAASRALAGLKKQVRLHNLARTSRCTTPSAPRCSAQLTRAV